MLNGHTNLSRRNALKTGAAGLLAAAGLSAVPSAVASDIPDEPNYGEGRTLTSSRGPNYGGGEDYVEEHDAGFTSNDANHVVESITELEEALEAAEYGEVVFVPGDAEIDTGARTVTARGPPGLHIPEGVTLASDRGVDGSPGGLIYTDTVADGWPPDNWPMAAHSDARVTGLRIRGRYWDWGEFPGSGPDAPHDGYVGGAGLIMGNADFNADPGTTTNVEVDNCEFYGWGYACVMAHTGADDCRVHHCDFHDTLRAGTGYGVSASNGHTEIDHNTFNRNRHAIASSGSRLSSYEAHHNVVGPYSMSHVFDVHDPGGDRFDIHHNTIRSIEQNNEYRNQDKNTPGVAMRGYPTDEMKIHNNWFYNPKEPRENPHTSLWTDEAIIQVLFEGDYDVPLDEWANVDFHRNHYGTESDPKGGIGAPHSDKVSF